LQLQHSILLKTVAKEVGKQFPELFVAIVAMNRGINFYHLATF